MELAIPIIALGGMYVISNQKNKSCNSSKKKSRNDDSTTKTNDPVFTDINGVTENYSNMGLRGQNTSLPNTNLPTPNYPVLSDNDLASNAQQYTNPNIATDKYFNQNYYENRVNQGNKVDSQIQNVYSLSGNYLDSKEFKHNNMVPFYGGKIKGYTYDVNVAETVLDNMAGTGSQIIKKIEQAPLFKPEENINWAYGTPNNNDFYQSRVNPAMNNNNVKPFETQRVGPGLNQGYNSEGSGGFNSGMEARDYWLPKTVDQLRVATNPKLEYSLANHEGPADAYIKNLGLIGRVEKQKPDTFFINTQDRWLTTTGAEKGETLRPIQEMGVIRRMECDTNYKGPAGSASGANAMYTVPSFEISKRNEVLPGDMPHPRAIGKGQNHEDEEIIRNYNILENHRTTVNQVDTIRSGFSRAIGAVIAPLMDVLKPSRKEEVVQNVRVYGEAKKGVPNSYVINPLDVTPTTIKETTLQSVPFYINGQKNKEYVDNNTPLKTTERETTDVNYFGTSGGAATSYGDVLNESFYNQTNNDIKSQTIYNRINTGNAQLFNPNYNVNNCKNDSNCNDGRWFTPSAAIPLPPAKENYGSMHMPQYYNECITCERIAPDILNAFRANPYTHSLTDSV
jgi:Family of unknown function (DUF5899)